MKQLTVLLADDHQIGRTGFRELLAGEAHLIVVGEAHTGHQAVDLASKLRPNLVVMDMAMPLLNGVDATRQIRQAVPHCQVLLLYAPGAEAYLEQAVAAGAAGFLSNESLDQTLCRAIRRIQRGKKPVHPARQRRPVGANAAGPQARPLTGPETEVLHLLTAGKANRETAAALGKKVKTVARHRDRLMEKLTPPDLTGLTLKVLADTCTRLAAGDLGARTGLAPGKGGLGRLTRTFDQMAQSLERREAARQQSEKALHVSETRYHQLFKNAQDGILILNATTGKIDDVNPFLINLLGLSREQLLGNTLWDTGPFKDIDASKAEFRKLQREGYVRYEDLPLETSDGRSIHVEFVSNVYLMDGHKVIQCNIRDITERKQAETNRKEYSQKLQVLSRRLVETQETERRHLARELHDEIGQALTVAQVNLQVVLQLPAARDFKPRLAESLGVIERVLQQVRNIALDLRPSMLDDLGLEPALQYYTRRQAALTGLACEIRADPLSRRLDSLIETECFRVAQEALTNIARHARARHVTVELRKIKNQIHLRVKDDGIGFDVARIRERAVQGASLGLLSMEERAALAGGQLELSSAPGQGAEVHAWFPLKWRTEPA